MHHPTDRITHTKAFVTPVVEHWLEREIAQFHVKQHTKHIFIIVSAVWFWKSYGWLTQLLTSLTLYHISCYSQTSD